MGESPRELPKAALWPHIGGPLLVLGTAAAVELLSRGPFRFPNPPAVLLLTVVFSAFVGGLGSGLVAAVIAWLYFARFFSIPGHPLQYTAEDLRRVLVWAAATPAMAVMVGVLKQRGERALRAASENDARVKQMAERLRTEQDLRRFAAIVADSDDAILSKTLDGTILTWNAGAERIYGYTAEEIIGQPVGRLVPADRPREIPDLLERLKRGERIAHFETVRVRKDGALVDVALTISPIKDAGGSIIGASAIGRDITERKRVDREIRALNRELEDRVRQRTSELDDANKELEAFAYTVAHDLRSPLITLSGFSQMLMEDHAAALPEEAQRLVVQIANSSRHMSTLIDELLAFSRMGRQPLTQRPVAPAEVARQALSELDGAGRDRPAAVRVSDLPGCQADPALLKQVFTNLLSNALKFSRDRESALVEVGWRRDLDDPTHHTYFVADNGVGFDMNYADKLFRVFQRLHRMEEYEGTGVGLAIVQRIIHRHGGRVWAEGAPGKGATFYFTLPRSDGA